MGGPPPKGRPTKDKYFYPWRNYRPLRHLSMCLLDLQSFSGRGVPFSGRSPGGALLRKVPPRRIWSHGFWLFITYIAFEPGSQPFFSSRSGGEGLGDQIRLNAQGGSQGLPP